MRSLSDWHGAPIAVVGIGVLPGDGLSDTARHAVQRADVVIGSKRQLAVVAGAGKTTLQYPSPLSDLWPQLESLNGRRVVLLASGDPLLFGIGASLLRRYRREALEFHPNVSSLQLAFARLGLPWQDTILVSLHGRPLHSLKSRLQANRYYGLLTDRQSHPQAIAELLTEAGFGASKIWVVEDLGAATERVSHFQAESPPRETYSDLNVVVVQSLGSGGILPEFPGIPDTDFSTDGDEPGAGMISKREVRLTILSLLSPSAGDVGWDVGAGCGGVAIEWSRWNRLGEVHAVECQQSRVMHLKANRDKFGVVSNLHIHHGRAPEALGPLPDPHAVFVGGSDGNLESLLEISWKRLVPGGRLVAAAVTEDSRISLHRFAHGQRAGCTQISVARGENLGSQRVLRPNMPVLLMHRTKA